MNELPISTKIAAKVLFDHTRYSMKLTGRITTLALILVWCGFKLSHHAFGLQILQQHQIAIMVTILFIHLIPVNIFAVRKILNRDFENFKLIAVKPSSNINPGSNL